MAYNPISTAVVKNDQSGVALTLRAGTSDYPLMYNDQMWQIATDGSALYNALGATGSYTQEVINNFLLEHIAAGVVSIEVVSDHTAVASPSTTTLYLETSTSGTTLFTTYTYDGSTWTSAGNITLDLTKYIFSSDALTNGNLVYANGDKSLASVGVTKTDIEALIKDFKGSEQASLPNDPADGTIAKLLQEYREGDGLGSDYVLPVAGANDLGGIQTGFTQDDTNKKYPLLLDENNRAYVQVPWTGMTTLANGGAAGLMSPDEYFWYLYSKTDVVCTTEDAFKNAVLTALNAGDGRNAIAAPLLISTTNCFGISTSSDYRVMATFTKKSNVTGSTAFEARFSVGNYDFVVTYNGTTFTLYHTDYVQGDAVETTFAI